LDSWSRSILFTLIERWFPDPLVPTYYYRGAYYQMADALACVIIAFPVYPWVTRSILRQMQLHPEKLASSVRKWLTYIALLIAACIVIGDLITFLTYFLRGELTTRHRWWRLWYHFGSLRKADSIASPASASASTGVKP
jgi:hypothetical protein